MPRRITEDHKHFRDIIAGRTRKELRRLFTNGGFISNRPKGGKMHVNIPGIEQPRIVFGDNGKNKMGRGEGKEGDVVGYEPGDGQGSKAGEEHAEGIVVGVELEEFLKFLKDELQLPEMKPKPSQTYEETRIRYNDISRQGPESLRHTRRTMLQAAKRLAATGDLTKLHKFPGTNIAMPLIAPINADKRYRQYQEEKIPSSNAVIFFMRDYSGSMDKYRCDIVSDMCFWIDLWIRQYYTRMERCYVIHDTNASEVSPEKFYGISNGGGTRCSSGFELIANILENRFDREQYNIYVFYFTDGENWGTEDNQKVVELIKTQLGPDVVNMIGITEIAPYEWGETLKQHIDKALQVDENHVAKLAGSEHVRTALIKERDAASENREKEILDAIKAIIGKERVFS